MENLNGKVETQLCFKDILTLFDIYSFKKISGRRFVRIFFVPLLFHFCRFYGNSISHTSFKLSQTKGGSGIFRLKV